MKKLLLFIALIMPFMAISQTQTIPAKDIVLKNRIVNSYGDTIVSPNPDSSRQFLIKNVADPEFPLDAVNYRTLLDKTGNAETDSIQFSTDITNLVWHEGKLFYDSTKHALTYYNESDEVSLNISREIVDRRLNNTGSTIPNLTPVYCVGNNWQIADAHSYDKTRNVYIATEDIPNGKYGYATTVGEVSGNLTGFSNGDVVYLGNGILTKTFPVDGDFIVYIGTVLNNGINGVLDVRPKGSEYTADLNKVRGWTSYLQGEKSNITFTNGTRTLTVTPIGDLHVYQAGIKYEILGAANFQISNVEGSHFVYFDQGVLNELVNPSHAQIVDIIKNKVTVSVIYWDATNLTAIYVSNERHTINMQSAVQSYLHQTRGTQYLSGLTPLNVGSGTGTVNADAQFGIDAGVVADEDVETSAPVVASTAGLPIYYRSGTNWRKTSRSGYSFLNDGGTGLVQYNKLTTGTWSVQSMTNNYYGLIHVFCTNGIYTQSFAFMGVNEYASALAAETAISDEILSIKAIGFPFAEAKHIATFIFQTKSSFANSVKMDLVLTATGSQFKDYRTATDSPIGGTSATTGTFLSLNDTPATYAGHANKAAKVNATESGLEFSTITLTDGAIANATTIDASGNITGSRFVSTQTTGTSPLSVSSTTVNSNLNADLLDGNHASAFITSITTTGSITGNGEVSPLQLTNDETSPAALEYYGTDASGTKGFHALPQSGLVAYTIYNETELLAAWTDAQTYLAASKSVIIYIAGTVTLTANRSFKNTQPGSVEFQGIGQQTIAIGSYTFTVNKLTFRNISFTTTGTIYVTVDGHYATFYDCWWYSEEFYSGTFSNMKIAIKTTGTIVNNTGAITINGMRHASGSNSAINDGNIQPFIVQNAATWGTSQRLYFIMKDVDAMRNFDRVSRVLLHATANTVYKVSGDLSWWFHQDQNFAGTGFILSQSEMLKRGSVDQLRGDYMPTSSTLSTLLGVASDSIIKRVPVTAYDVQQIDTLSLSNDTLKISIQRDGVAQKKVDLYSLRNVPLTFSANSTFRGEYATGTAGENLVFGDFVYFKFSDGKWYKAKADAYATARCRGIALATINTSSTGNILTRGTIRYDTWDWTTAEVWLSAATAGSGTSTQPSTTGNQIQFLGTAISADILFFNPSNDIGEK